MLNGKVRNNDTTYFVNVHGLIEEKQGLTKFIKVPKNLYIMTFVTRGLACMTSAKRYFIIYYKLYGDVFLDRFINEINIYGTNNLLKEAYTNLFTTKDPLQKAVYKTVIAFCNQTGMPEATNVILHRPNQDIINYKLLLNKSIVNLSQALFVDDDYKFITNDDVINSGTKSPFSPAIFGFGKPGDEIFFRKIDPQKDIPISYYVKDMDILPENSYAYSYEMGAYNIKHGNFIYLKNMNKLFNKGCYLSDLIENLPQTSNPNEYNILFLSACKSSRTGRDIDITQGIQRPYIQQKITTSPITQSLSFLQQPKKQLKTPSYVKIQPRRRRVPRQILPQPEIMNSKQRKLQKNILLEQSFCDKMARIGKKVLGC